MTYTFQGGILLDKKFGSRQKNLAAIPAPEAITLFLTDSDGRRFEPIVKEGDTVCVGQTAAVSDGDPARRICSGISGTVETVLPDRVVIRGDGEMRPDPNAVPFSKRLGDCTPEELLDTIKKAGIPDFQNGGFLADTLEGLIGRAKTLIVSGVSCRPNVTSQMALLNTKPVSVINGIKILMKLLGLRKSFLAMSDAQIKEANRVEALLGNSGLIEIRIVKNKYPQNLSPLLVCAVTESEPKASLTLAEAGYAVFDCATCADLFDSFYTGLPVTSVRITAGGDCVRLPRNLTVPIGTSFRDVFAACGGFRTAPDAVIQGDLITGRAVSDLSEAVSFTTVGLFAVSRTRKEAKRPVCLHCGRCTEVCPMHLQPYRLAALAEAGRPELCRKESALRCLSCGACSHVCPGSLPLRDRIAQIGISDRISTRKEDAPDDNGCF